MGVTTAELKAIITLQDQMSAQLTKVKSELAQLGGAARTAGSQAAASGPSWMSMASAMTTGTVAGNLLYSGLQKIMGMAQSAGKASSEFGQSIANIKAMAPTADVEKYGGAIEKLALRLGKDYPLSASEAGKAIETLVQKGTSLDKIVGGAAEAVVKLSAATGGDLVTAAEVVNAALDTFNMSADDTVKVTSVMTGAMLNGGMTLTDFKYGMNSAGAVVKLMGGSVDDLAIALTAMAKAGIEGSDAGTSIKTMYMNLQPSTRAQIALFNELGITTADGGNKFFDAAGKAKSYEEIAQILNQSLKGMTEKQKQATLEIMFGTDGIRAAAIATNMAAGQYGELGKAVRSVDPDEVARKRMDSLEGSLKQFGGSAETIGIVLMSKLAPGMMAAVDTGTQLLNLFLDWLDTEEAAMVFDSIAKEVADLGNTLYALGAQVQGPMGSVFIGLAAIIRGDAMGAFEAFRQALSEMLPALIESALKAYDTALAIGTIAIAVMEQLGGAINILIEHKDAVLLIVEAWLVLKAVMTTMTVITTVAGAISTLTGVISGTSAVLPVLAEAGAAIATAWGVISGVVVAAATAIGSAIAAVVSAVGLPVIAIAALVVAVVALAAAWYFNWDGIQEKTAETTGVVMDTLSSWGSALSDWASAAWESVKSTVQSGWNSIVETTSVFGDSIMSALQSAWDSVVSSISGLMASLKSEVVKGYEAVFTEPTRAAISKLVSDLGELWTAVVSLAGRLMTQVVTRVSEGWAQVVATVTEYGRTITSVVSAVWTTVVAAVVGFLSPVVAAVSNVWEVVVTTVSSYGNAIMANVSSVWSAVVSTITGFLAPIVATVTDTWNQVVSVVAGLGASIVSTVTGFAGELYSAASSLANNIVAGLRDGLNSRVQEIAGAASALVRSAINAANDTAKVESPSKETQKTGQFMGEGLAKGIAELEPQVAAAMKHLIDSALAYRPIASQVAQVEKEIKDIRDAATTSAMFREQQMTTITSEQLRLKKDMVETERRLLPLRRDLANATKAVADIERGTLDQRVKILEGDTKQKEIRLKILDLEEKLASVKSGSKAAKSIQEEIDKLQEQSDAIGRQAERIRLTNDIAAGSARIRKETLDDQLKGQEKNIEAIQRALDVLDSEKSVFAANEAVINNATNNEVGYRERLIAVFKAEGKPLADRIEAGLALIDQLKDEGKISEELAGKLKDVVKQAQDGRLATAGLGSAAATANPQLEAAGRMADQMAKDAADIAREASGAKKEVKDLGDTLGKMPSLFDVNFDFNFKKRHGGGPVQAGTPYVVGKPGAEELFVPQGDGLILSNDVTRGLMSGGSDGASMPSMGPSRGYGLTGGIAGGPDIHIYIGDREIMDWFVETTEAVDRFGRSG